MVSHNPFMHAVLN